MRSRRWHSSTLSVGLCLGFAAFAYANLASWRDTGRPVGLGITLLEGFTAVLFIWRRPPRVTSGRVVAWLAAPVGTFAVLLARPVAQP